MQQIYDIIENLSKVQLIDIGVAFVLIIICLFLSSYIAFWAVKIFNWKENRKEIKLNPFYVPLKIILKLLALYIGILYLKTPIGMSDNLMEIISKLFKIIAIISVAKGVGESLNSKSQFVRMIVIKSGKKYDDAMLESILKLIKAIIYIVAAFLVAQELNFNLGGLITGLGISTVVITLAAQNTMKNLFGGLDIFLDRPFQIGDWIQVHDYEGTVEGISFRSTKIRTFENSLLSIPNSALADYAIINWSKMETRRYKMTLCLERDTDLEKIKRVSERIKSMLFKHEDVLDESIIVKFDSIEQNGINLLIMTYTDSVDYNSYVNAKETINYKIMQILKEEGVSLAYDTKTVHIAQ